MTVQHQPPPPRRFQFRLRTLLIGVTLFCIVVGGYIGSQLKVIRERREAVTKNRTVASVPMITNSNPPGVRWPSIRFYPRPKIAVAAGVVRGRRLRGSRRDGHCNQ